MPFNPGLPNQYFNKIGTPSIGTQLPRQSYPVGLAPRPMELNSPAPSLSVPVPQAPKVNDMGAPKQLTQKQKRFLAIRSMMNK
jgi:hypothetical protein